VGIGMETNRTTQQLEGNAAQDYEQSIVGCTIAYSDEWPSAVVLGDAFHHFHPRAQFVVLLIDRPNDQLTLPNGKVLSVGDLGLAPGEEWRLPMLFSRTELRLVLQPALLKTLLTTNAQAAVYFSPTTDIFHSLSSVLETVRGADVIVATDPIQNECGDGGRSFVGVPAVARPQLQKWFDDLRQRFDPDADVKNATLQALDAVFHSLPHRLASQAGFGVNYSSLDPTSLHLTERGWEIAGQPLRSFDFRGYDPEKPYLLSRYLGPQPRILLSEHAQVAELCGTYRKKLVRVGGRGKSMAGAFAFLPSGLRIDARMLRIYRRALLEYGSGTASEPPNPFGPEGEQGFLKWLNEPIDRARAGVTRYMLAVHEERDDVKAAFPDPSGADAAAFRNWYFLYGRREFDLPAAVVPSRNTCPSAQPALPVNVAGYFRAELGIGAAGRAIIAALEAAEIPINTVTFDRTANRLAHPFDDRASAAGQPDINLICINPDQIGAFVEQAGPEFSQGRYNIGVWFWEVEDFPVWSHHAFNYVDEVWVASEFMRQTFLKVSPKPVFKFRLPILRPRVDASLSRSQLNLPDEFTFLFSFDFLSVFERKNPAGLVEAFRTAFQPGEGPRLVIKTINGDKRIPELEKLKYVARGRPDILLVDRYLSALEVATLTHLADCYVSLHRSEGFGLTIAEAMALGKPAIATAYSGNLDFMTPENSYLCPVRLCEVGPGCEPYPAESHWSEPDIGKAAELLRRVYQHREEAQARGVRAAADLRASHSPTLAGGIISDRLSIIRRRRANGSRAYSIEFLQDRLEELEARLSKQL
jgi:glycosyltransferase involved in cell wall biosynthesis